MQLARTATVSAMIWQLPHAHPPGGLNCNRTLFAAAMGINAFSYSLCSDFENVKWMKSRSVFRYYMRKSAVLWTFPVSKSVALQTLTLSHSCFEGFASTRLLFLIHYLTSQRHESGMFGLFPRDGFRLAKEDCCFSKLQPNSDQQFTLK